MKRMSLLVVSALLAGAVWAKIPAPAVSAEGAAKAAEAAAKTAHGNKVANFQLCKSMEKATAHYFKTAKAAGKDTKPALTTPACEDPGAFVYTPAVAPASAAKKS